MKFKCMSTAVLFVCVLAVFNACAVETSRQDDNGKEEIRKVPSDYSAAKAAQELLPQKLVKIGFAQAGHESDWRIAVTKACQEAFSEENGYQIFFVDANQNPEAQVAAVRNFIQEQVDYIVIAPVLATGWTAVLKEAYHVGIPVFLIDQTVDCDQRYYQAWFGSDYEAEGECAGRWLQNYLSGKGRGREMIHIAAINGREGTAAQTGRSRGFAKYLEQQENWRLLAQESGDFTESGGRQVMEEYLKKYSDIDVVLCQNDNEAAGACMALDEAGISYGKDRKNEKDGDVVVISFDASEAGLKAVLEGKIHADFACSSYAPFYVAEAVRRLEAGNTLLEKEYYLPEECFTCVEYPAVITIPAGIKRMILVTKEVLENRFYKNEARYLN